MFGAMQRLGIVGILVGCIVGSTAQVWAEDSPTVDLVARPNQLPSGHAEYGLVLGLPAGPERDPPVDEWKHNGIGGWITGTLYLRVGVSEKLELEGTGTLSMGHPENTPGDRANRMGGGTLTASYRINPHVSATAGLAYVEPWLAMYGLYTFQHYAAGSDLRLGGRAGGRFGAVATKRVRLQGETWLTVVPGVPAGSDDETWVLLSASARADIHVVENLFVGLRAELRTGNGLSVAPSDGATLPVILQPRYVFDQLDLGLDVGFGSVLTSSQLASRVAYTDVHTSFYLGAVLNWRLP